MKAQLEKLDDLFEILPTKPALSTPWEEEADDDMVLIS